MNTGGAMKTVVKYWYIPLVIAIFIISLSIRMQPAKFGDITGLDEYYFYRITYDMVNGFNDIDYSFGNITRVNILTIPEKDMMRHHPFGANIRKIEPPMPFYLPVVSYLVLKALGITMDFQYFAVIFPAIMAALATLAMFFIGRELYGNKGGVIASFLATTVLGFINRTVACSYEKEAFVAVFIVMGMYFFIKGVRTKRVRDGIISGISLAFVNMTWGGVAYIFLVMALFSIAHAILCKKGESIYRIYTPMAFIGIFLPYFFPGHQPIEQPIILAFFISVFIVLLRRAADGFSFNLGGMKLGFRGVRESNTIYIIPAALVVLLISFLVSTMFMDMTSNMLGTAFRLMSMRQDTGSTTVAEQIPGTWNDFVSSTSVQQSSALLPQLSAIAPFLAMWIFMFAGIATLAYEIYRTRKIIFLFPIILSILAIWGNFYMIRLLYLIGFSLPLAATHFFVRGIDLAGRINIGKLNEKADTLLLFFGAAFLLFAIMSFGSWYTLMVFMAISVPMILGGYAMKKKIIKGIKLVYIPIAVFFMLFACMATAAAYTYSGSMGPIFNEYWADSMNYLATKTPHNGTNVISWWDFGYWFQAKGHRASVSDGGGVGPRYDIAIWYVDDPSNWTKYEDWLFGKYKVTHILMDYTLPGKYGAISKIASDGKSIVGFLEFGRNPTATYPKGNTTIVEFRNGPYALWLPLSHDGNVAGMPVFLQMSGDQFVGRAYIQDVCTSDGIINTGNQEPMMKGCIVVAPWAVYYVPPEAEHTIFTRLQFMDGYGLPVKKVFDNGLIHIFETELASASGQTKNPELSPLLNSQMPAA